MLLKTRYIFLFIIFTIVISGFYVFKPTTCIHLGDRFDTFNANIIRSYYHVIRKFRDPSFRDGAYLGHTSNTSVDVVIPIVEKDILTASKAIPALRAMLMHPIDKIYLVAPESKKLRTFAKEFNCIFVLETDVVEDFEQIKQLGGWFIQQFIKLSVDRVSSNEHILITDADTILLRPQAFINNRKGKYTFNLHSDYAPISKKFTENLLKLQHYVKLDFVCHHMLFKREWLQELKSEIEKIHGKKWNMAMLDLAVDKKNGSLSEYDIYATYVYLHHYKNVRLHSSANAFIYRDRFQYFDQYAPVFAADYKSVSSHHFMKLENKSVVSH